MSRVEKTLEVPATTRTIVEHTACDLCGFTTKNTNNWGGKSSYDVDETTIEMQQGNNYGADGGNIKTTEVDICPTCFEKKLIPWLRTQGAKPRVHESDW